MKMDSNYFLKYTNLVKEKNIDEAMLSQEVTLQQFFNKINEEKSMYAYSEGKWTLKELLQHIIDTERIFSYRALAIARKEAITLPGFDENFYANNSFANNRTWESLTKEMKVVRESTILLYQSFSDEMLQQVGKFGNATGSPTILGLIMAGHVYHHIKIAEERYLSTV